MSMRRYTCEGSVRGRCGTLHRTVGRAVACCKRDAMDVKRGHGESAYSDRTVKAVIVESVYSSSQKRFIAANKDTDLTESEMREIDYFQGID